MKFYLLIGILLIYFPVLIYFKNRIIGETADVDKPEHLRWYEGASYIISHTTDAGKRSKLIKLREQIRIAGIMGIVVFWLVVLFFP
jgi:hypothetical protein